MSTVVVFAKVEGIATVEAFLSAVAFPSAVALAEVEAEVEAQNAHVRHWEHRHLACALTKQAGCLFPQFQASGFTNVLTH